MTSFGDLNRERFSSAEKNQRVMLTQGMNTSRAEDIENIEPNRLMDQ
jgi:hypothetical protein